RAVTRFRFVRTLAPIRLPRVAYSLNLVLLGALLIGVAAFAARQPGMQLGMEPRTDGLPVAGARFIREHDLPGPVFNFQPWGGYLIHEWYPERRVFIDGRMDMYGKVIVDDYLDVAAAKPQWAEILDRYGIQTALLPKGSALASVLSVDPHWRRL